MDQMYSFFRILENKIHLKRIVRQFAAAPIKINSTYKNKYKKPNTDSFIELVKYNNFIYNKADELVIWTSCPKSI